MGFRHLENSVDSVPISLIDDEIRWQKAVIASLQFQPNTIRSDGETWHNCLRAISALDELKRKAKEREQNGNSVGNRGHS